MLAVKFGVLSSKRAADPTPHADEMRKPSKGNLEQNKTSYKNIKLLHEL